MLPARKLGTNAAAHAEQAVTAQAALPLPGTQPLPQSAKSPAIEGGPSAKEVAERAVHTHVLHAVGNAFLNCGKGIAGLFCTLGCVVGGLVAGYSQIFTVVAFTLGSYASIPGGAIGLIAGTLVGKPFQGAAKGAEIGAHVGQALLAIPTAIVMAIPYLAGSALLKASAKGVEKTIGISDKSKEFIKFVLFVEYKVDWEKVKQKLPEAFQLFKAKGAA